MVLRKEERDVDADTRARRPAWILEPERTQGILPRHDWQEYDFRAEARGLTRARLTSGHGMFGLALVARCELPLSPSSSGSASTSSGRLTARTPCSVASVASTASSACCFATRRRVRHASSSAYLNPGVFVERELLSMSASDIFEKETWYVRRLIESRARGPSRTEVLVKQWSIIDLTRTAPSIVLCASSRVRVSRCKSLWDTVREHMRSRKARGRRGNHMCSTFFRCLSCTRPSVR
ncbi:hypothetical protein C8Q80DRAFT_1173939 [Daedaleopsis nitida]|nr:hypothetical protein C8Q80DRAFT_1173939 [Daedaleopsis nitida]